MNLWNERTPDVFVIYDTEEKTFYRCRSGKMAWHRYSYATSAFKNCTGAHFANQDRFEVKNIGKDWLEGMSNE